MTTKDLGLLKLTQVYLWVIWDEAALLKWLWTFDSRGTKMKKTRSNIFCDFLIAQLLQHLKIHLFGSPFSDIFFKVHTILHDNWGYDYHTIFAIFPIWLKLRVNCMKRDMRTKKGHCANKIEIWMCNLDFDFGLKVVAAVAVDFNLRRRPSW